ncbi:MAG TPA: thiamine-phosphate kinase [Bacilli bacterium]|nr:thiamine-phosphate kinase [Bacilli bacterium]
MKIGEIGEFGLIDRLAAKLGPVDPSVVVGIGDDAAVLAYADGMEVVTTTDMLVEGVHFREDTISDRLLGWKSIAVSISDVAAMGGRPKHAVVSLAVPVELDVERLEELYEGIGDVCRAYGVTVVGGDVVKTTGPFVISVTVLGEVEQGKALVRSGAKPGDQVFVTGFVGGSAAGLSVVQEKELDELGLPIDEAQALLRFHQRPEPQVAAGRLLVESEGCTSANDVSDGLASELNEIAKMSGVKLVVDGASVPMHEAVSRYAEVKHVDAMEWALFGGEDYQLVGTVDSGKVDVVRGLFAEQGLVISVIGRVEVGAGVELVRGEERVELLSRGFNHFG